MGSYGHAVDWWSLGSIACVMLTGKTPTVQPSTEPDGQPEIIIPPILHPPSRDLLLRLLELQPEKRVRSLRALQNIAFFKGYKFDEVKIKKVNAKKLLIDSFGEDYNKKRGEEEFENFDEIFIFE